MEGWSNAEPSALTQYSNTPLPVTPIPPVRLTRLPNRRESVLGEAKVERLLRQARNKAVKLRDGLILS